MDFIAVLHQYLTSSRRLDRNSLDEYPDIILFPILSSPLWVWIRFPLSQITCYTFDHNLCAKGNDLGEDIGAFILNPVKREGCMLLKASSAQQRAMQKMTDCQKPHGRQNLHHLVVVRKILLVSTSLRLSAAANLLQTCACRL
jgi:hypothetical protein